MGDLDVIGDLEMIGDLEIGPPGRLIREWVIPPIVRLKDELGTADLVTCPLFEEP